jgi:hypothetical protein
MLANLDARARGRPVLGLDVVATRKLFHELVVGEATRFVAVEKIPDFLFTSGWESVEQVEVFHEPHEFLLLNCTALVLIDLPESSTDLREARANLHLEHIHHSLGPAKQSKLGRKVLWTDGPGVLSIQRVPELFHDGVVEAFDNVEAYQDDGEIGSMHHLVPRVGHGAEQVGHALGVCGELFFHLLQDARHTSPDVARGVQERRRKQALQPTGGRFD